MKRITTLLILVSAAHVGAQNVYTNFVRQIQQTSKVTWDMQVAPFGSSPAPLALDGTGALFQLWTIDQTQVKDYLLDQRMVGTFIPKVDIKINTLDTKSAIPRTRIDKPFSVDVTISGLLPSGPGIPKAATNVIFQRFLANSPANGGFINSQALMAGEPNSSSIMTDNGTIRLNFPVSSLTAANPLKAKGEEFFAAYTTSASDKREFMITSNSVQVWPVATGAIQGIANGEKLRFTIPNIDLLLNDLYPRSDTYLLLFQGTQITEPNSVVVNSYPLDRANSESTVIQVDNLGDYITADGTHTLALVSDTVYGRELLCNPITFSVNTTIKINAMLVDSD